MYFVSTDDSRVELANSTLFFVICAISFLVDGLYLDSPDVKGPLFSQRMNPFITTGPYLLSSDRDLNLNLSCLLL